MHPFRPFFVFMIMCLGFSGLWAHGDLDEQIKELSKQIKKDPGNPELYQKRGRLHQQHEDFKAARADFRMVLRLNPMEKSVSLDMASLYLQFDKPDSALVHANFFCSLDPSDAAGRFQRARIHQRLNHPVKSRQDYYGALSNWEEPDPGFFLEFAKAQFLWDSSQVDSALYILNLGLKEMPGLVQLESEALEYEIKAERWTPALLRLDRMIEKMPNPIPWQIRKAEVQELAGDLPAAAQTWQKALSAVEKLPRKKRETGLGRTWHKTASAGLERTRQ